MMNSLIFIDNFANDTFNYIDNHINDFAVLSLLKRLNLTASLNQFIQKRLSNI